MDCSYQLTPGEPSVLDNVVRKLRRILGCDGAAALLTSIGTPSVYCCAAADGLVGPFEKGRVVHASQTPLVSTRRGWTVVDDGMGREAHSELRWSVELPSSLWVTVTREDGSLVGAVALFDRRPSRFSGDEVPMLSIVSDQIRDILSLYSSLDAGPDRDEATGLYTAAQGRRRLAEELERSVRYGHFVSVVVLAIEGPPSAGGATDADDDDAALSEIGEAIGFSLRSTDHAVVLTPQRYLVIAPETDPAGALAISARLASQVWHAMAGVGPHAVYAGTATTSGGQATPEELMRSASRCARRAATADA